MGNVRYLVSGDCAVTVEFGNEISPEINRKITATVQLMKEQHIEGVVDMIPAFCSLLVNYDPRVISYDDLKKRLEILLKMEVTAGEGCRKVYEIPVCYGGEYGPDHRFLQVSFPSAAILPENPEDKSLSGNHRFPHFLH